MTIGFTVRRAMGDADIAAVGRLLEAYAASLPIDLGHESFAAEVEGLPGNFAPPLGALLLALNPAGEAIGCVGLRPLPIQGACEMKRLYVAPAGRSFGVGKALGAAIIREARDCGYSTMYLDTLPGMEAAQSLYRNLGFEKTSPYYHSPYCGMLFYRLEIAT
jgi:ribosomal protein S18 acetylase RimI-like enzyme